MDCDFSNLAVWQAYLQGVNLHNVNFAHSVFAKSVFTQDFKEILSVAFSPTRNLLATGDVYGEIKLWLLDEEKNELKLQFSSKKHTELIHSLAFSPDGEILASGSDDQTLKLCRDT